MNILRRAAHAVLDLEKVRCEKTVKVFRKTGFYRRILGATGTEPKIAVELEAKVLAVMDEGIVDQHEIFSRFVRGEIGVIEFVREWKNWFDGYGASCDRAAFDALWQNA